MQNHGILYYIRIEADFNIYYKIGVTNRTVAARFPASDDRKKITVLFTKHYDKLEDGYKIEQQTLKCFNEFKYNGEHNILKGGGHTEMFIEDVLQLDNI